MSTVGIETPTDNDVLCGRGKGIRKHPGNGLYNRLLRENYPEYSTAPKGSKLMLVKKIVSLVRDQKGRFLERRKIGNDWVYSDIGEERAINKTAQAFRDIRPTMEKEDPSLERRRFRPKPKPKQEQKKPSSISSSSDLPRRPTFRERLAMLERERKAMQASSDESTEESENEEDEISDTETEDSLPM